MGMFDYFRSSYNLGEHFTDVVCQTKDIEDGIGGTLTFYWLDPLGRLYYCDYFGTHELKMYKEGDKEYNPDKFLLNHAWIPTGKHGKLKFHPITKYIQIYPEKCEGSWKDWPRLRLHFRNGILQDFERVDSLKSVPETIDSLF